MARASTALFGRHAGVRAGRIHEGEHGQAWRSASEKAAVPCDSPRGGAMPKLAWVCSFRVAALLMADHQLPRGREPADAAHDRRIVGAQPIAFELLEAVDEQGDVVARARPVLVAGNADSDPGVMPAFLAPQASSASPGACRSLPTNGFRA